MDGITRVQAKALFAVRLIIGWGFLYAGLEKIFDLAGSGKPFSAAGFLKFATGGTWPGVAAPEGAAAPIVNPTHDFWVSLGGNAALLPIINTLVVFGETAIGIALILGLATRFAALSGFVMMALFYVAAWDFGFGLVNEHMAYMLACTTVGVLGAGRYYGLDAIVEKLGVVRTYPALKL
ncbi:MAG TPA: TQO small subunit DoxD, partial [Candidatus Limnocylindrales bacterium]